MNSFLRRALCGALFSVVVGSSAVWADIPAPKPYKVHASLEVRLNEKADKTKLVVPRSVFPDLPPKYSQTQDRTRTVIAGVALTTAVTLAGLVFLRRKGVTAKPLAGLMVGATLAIGGTAWANLAPPVPPAVVRDVGRVLGMAHNIEIEVTEDGEVMALVLDRNTFDQLDEAGSIRPKKGK